MAKVILSFWSTFEWCVNLTNISSKTGCLPNTDERFIR